jgi:hypothetical protein
VYYSKRQKRLINVTKILNDDYLKNLIDTTLSDDDILEIITNINTTSEKWDRNVKFRYRIKLNVLRHERGVHK